MEHYFKKNIRQTNRQTTKGEMILIFRLFAWGKDKGEGYVEGGDPNSISLDLLWYRYGQLQCVSLCVFVGLDLDLV